MQTLEIYAQQPPANVSRLHYGLMTEEINYCYDGGLYAELVRNRAFLNDPLTPVHWSIVPDGSAASTSLDAGQPLNGVIPTSLRMDVFSASPDAPAGIANGGYWGIPVKPDTQYRASFYMKSASDFSGPVTVAIESDDGTTIYAKAEVCQIDSIWKPFEVVLTTGRNVTPTTKARFTLTVQTPCTVWFSLVSLFPPTWNDRPNGLRPDIMQMLVDLKPAFLRFPGGNYLEGDTIETRFDWKKTLGPTSQRPGHLGTWGYRSSDGMGLLEFLLWCEDMGAEPVLGLYAGYSLKGAFIQPGTDLEPFVQDALDEIEYVTGPTTTKWGVLRATNGHPAPFKLRYVEIGNEDWFDKSGSYDGRFAQFFDAIKRRYPELKCISSVGSEQAPEKRVWSRTPDVLDEHFYRTADSFLSEFSNYYDNFDRSGPEIFVGEWAAHETAFAPWDARSKSEPPTPNMKAALGDAAFMVTMERNSDLVTMQCYAPLFANVNDYQWRPNLIGYDALNSFGSPSYYALRMFSRNVGDSILKAEVSGGSPLHASVTRDGTTGAIYIKLVNPEPTPQLLHLNLKGVHSLMPSAKVETLSSDPTATNSLAEPTKVVPIISEISGILPSFTYTLEPFSITVLHLTAKTDPSQQASP